MKTENIILLGYSLIGLQILILIVFAMLGVLK